MGYDGGQFIPQYRLTSSVRLVMYGGGTILAGPAGALDFTGELAAELSGCERLQKQNSW